MYNHKPYTKLQSYQNVIICVNFSETYLTQILCNCMDIPIDIKLNLFHAYVSPILCYSSEIWGLCDAIVIERVHRCYITWILNVKRTTTSNAIYGETGRFPLIINRKLITVLCISMYGLCPCACVAYNLIKVMLFVVCKQQT